MNKVTFKLFSDGSSFNNGYKKKELPQYASCAYCLVLGERVLSKRVEKLPDSTISVAELTGAIKAFELLYEKCKSLPKGALSKPYNGVLYSDSEYVVKGFMERMDSWKKSGWCTKAGSPVANLDLWKKLMELRDNKDLNISMIHVKAHTGKSDFLSKMNDLVDKLAQAEVNTWKKENGYK